MLTSENDIEISLTSASRNLGDQAKGLEAVPWKPQSTILDIGCGPGVHLDYFRSRGLVGTGLDRNPDYFRYHGEIEHVRNVDELEGRQFDFVFASHVLEHCPDTFSAILQWRDLLKDDGSIIIFVPPFWHDVSNDHWSTGWNVGQLAMTLVGAGFDCRRSTFYQTGNQVFGFGEKRPVSGSFMIDESLPYLPPAMTRAVHQGAEFQNLRGDIAFVSGDDIQYLPRRSAELSVCMPDETWLCVDRPGWKDVTVPPAERIRAGAEYLLAVESENEGPLRIAFTHDGVTAHGELWMQLVPGLNLRQFEPVEFMNQTRDFDVARTDLIAIGGSTPFRRAALFCEGRRVA